jgi:membrane peptidoglycan carboxypeptidase
MASAYGTIANEGVYNPPYLIERIEDRNGREIYTHEASPSRRISAETARLVTSILEKNVQSGTGTRAAVNGQRVAGKTGTNQGSRDGWFVGYSPALSTAVWVGGLGHEFTITLGGRGITGGREPAQIWGAFMNAWQQGRPSIPFTAPPSRPGGKKLEVPGGIDLTPAPAPAPLPPPGTLPPGFPPILLPGQGGDPGDGNGGGPGRPDTPDED